MTRSSCDVLYENFCQQGMTNGSRITKNGATKKQSTNEDYTNDLN